MPLSEDDDVSDDDNNDDIDMAAIDAVNRRRARERANGGGNGGDDDDEEEAPEDEEEMIEKGQAIGGWGHNKASYYEEHSSARSGASMPSQASRNEELEARRLQRAHNSAIDEEDFAGSMTSDVTSSAAAAEEGDKKKSGHENFTVEREMVEEISKDLNDISIVPGQQQKGGMEEIEKKLDGLTNEEKLNIIAQNSPELIALIGEFKSSLALVKSSYAPAMKKIAELDADALPADLARLCTFVKTKFRT